MKGANMTAIGTAVKILIRAGAVPKGQAYTATKYVGTIEPGRVGLYQGLMAGELGQEGWHIVALGAWDIPLHESHFEAL